MPKIKEAVIEDPIARRCAERIRDIAGSEPKELAYQVNVSLSALYNYMHGRIPSTLVLRRIAKYANHRMEWFLDESPPVASGGHPML